MPVFRMQCSWQFDSTFGTDAVIITPHFDDKGLGTDPEGLCQDLAIALDGWCVPPSPVTVKAYDAEGTPPVIPVGEHTAGGPSVPAAGFNRELALCLSFYAERNVRRQRGRLYIPMICARSSSPTGSRPDNADQTKLSQLVPILAGLGGADVDWVVWSRQDLAARKVTDWWVDNSWDVVRSRGARPTSRMVGTTSG